VVFTGDTGPSEAVIKLAMNADMLISEVADDVASERIAKASGGLSPELVKAITDHMMHEHLIPTEVGNLAAKAHVKSVLLTHLSPGLDNETDTSGYADPVKKYFTGPVIVGKDLGVYDVK
jgi:ribonuclease BN (tRNA processing enzyme)